MFIHNAATFLTRPADVKTLKEELKRYTDVYFRRINKFVMLALIGAYRCVLNQQISRDTSIYLTTENGNLGDTESVLSQIYRHHSLPMPYNFINTMANTASFYVAQGLNLTGRNISISSQNLSFERGLELLKTDMDLHVVRSALAGSVDEATASESHFREKSGLLHDQVNQVDRSCWLYLRSEQDGAVGEVTAIRSFQTKQDSLQWLETHGHSYSRPLFLSFGMAIGSEEKEAWKQRIRPDGEFDYIRDCGYLNATTACGVAEFVNQFKSANLLHVNKNFQDQYVILLMQCY
jgi:hypothetical protein